MATFHDIRDHLLTTYPAPLYPPAKPHEDPLTSQISALQLHPTLEAALHILNGDLPGAHFLVRHMQSPPAYEGMYLHGILHRLEGDYDNARMWYSDVQEADVYLEIWGGGGKSYKQGARGEELDDGQQFLNRAEGCVKGKEGGEEIRRDLEQQSRRELESVIEWCVHKFGTQKIEDASQAWAEPSDTIKSAGEDQVSGDAGRRKF